MSLTDLIIISRMMEKRADGVMTKNNQRNALDNFDIMSKNNPYYANAEIFAPNGYGGFYSDPFSSPSMTLAKTYKWLSVNPKLREDWERHDRKERKFRSPLFTRDLDSGKLQIDTDVKVKTDLPYLQKLKKKFFSMLLSRGEYMSKENFRRFKAEMGKPITDDTPIAPYITYGDYKKFDEDMREDVDNFRNKVLKDRTSYCNDGSDCYRTDCRRHSVHLFSQDDPRIY